MGTFKSQKALDCSPALLPQISDAIQAHFLNEGFEVCAKDSSTGAVNISISKGGLFKAVLGMKTALNINLQPKTTFIFFDAGVGIFGEQVIPTVISMFFLWPVLLTQIWGLVKQAKLDDHALEVAEEVIRNAQSQSAQNRTQVRYCVHCGAEIYGNGIYCSSCGQKQE